MTVVPFLDLNIMFCHSFLFLADSTNGRAYATVLCVCLSSVCDVM